MMDIRPYLTYHTEEVLPLYESAGWIAYTRNPPLLQQAFQGSLAAWAAYEQDTLVGLIRVVGDGASILYIQDLLVHPAHQRRGIGRHLLQAVLDAYPAVRQKVLLTDSRPDTLAFYRAAGFAPAGESDCTAMLYKE